MPLKVLNEKSFINLPDISHEDVEHHVSQNERERGIALPSFVRTFALEQVFEYEDKYEVFLEKNDVDKAYTTMKRKIDFGKDLIYARELVHFYKTAMLSKHSEKGGKVCEELITIIRQNTKTHPDEIESYAKKLERREKYMEAILFFQVAAFYYLGEGCTREGATGVTLCCEGIRNAAKNLLKSRGDLKPLVQHHIIPIMLEMKNRVERIRTGVHNGVERELLVNCELKCLHCIEYSEGRVADYEGRELTLKEGIQLIEVQMGTDCKKFGVYSLLLNNLACTFEVTHRFEEACFFYSKSIEAHMSAEDYQDEEHRKSDIAASERGLIRAKEKLLKTMGRYQRDSGPSVVGDC